MSWNDHDHRGQYADERHDHGLDYAERYHRHYDDESMVQGLREDLGRAEERICELEDDLRDALERIHALEDRQPDYAGDGADPDRPETWAFGEAPVPYGPGPEADGEGGMSECRHVLPEDYGRGQW